MKKYVIILALIGLCLAPKAHAGLDVQQPTANGPAVDLGNLKHAFTWKPNNTGTLTEVDLLLYIYADTNAPMTLELWSVDANHFPSSKLADLGSISQTGQTDPQNYLFRTLNIASPPNVTAGTEYALVFYTTSHYATDWVNLQGNVTSTYTLVNDGSSWNSQGGYQFDTYVSSTLNVQDTGGTGVVFANYNAARFTPTASGTLTSVAEYAYDLAFPATSTMHLEVHADNNGVPGSILTNGDMGVVNVNTAGYDQRKATPGTGPTVVAGTNYWIVSYPVTGAIAIAQSFATTGNRGAYSTNTGTTWYPHAAMFKTYVSTSTPSSTPARRRQSIVLACF